MKSITLELVVEKNGSRQVVGDLVTVVKHKVCAVRSGGKMGVESPGGEIEYSLVDMDSGMCYVVAGNHIHVGDWIGLDAD